MSASQASQDHAVTRAGEIFTLLKHAAEAGQQCPTNKLLAQRFSCGTARIVDALHFLESAGMIEVERKGCSRVITICATGQRTAQAIIWKETAEDKRRAA